MVRGILMFLVMAAGALAGCSGFSKNQQPATDPNVFPTNYRSALVAFLRQSLTNRSDFRGVMLSEPALKPVGPSQHYVCACNSIRKARSRPKPPSILPDK